MKVLIFACLCLFNLDSTTGWAAQVYVPKKQDELDQTWRWQFFDELKGKGLRSIAQDSAGAMWFGVDDGVLHYDGLAWTAFGEKEGLPKGPINALCTSTDGYVYAASDAGIARLEEKRWIEVFPRLPNFNWPIDDLEVDRKGRIWAATPWGAVRLGATRPLLYTSLDMANVLEKLAPHIDITIVPDSVVNAHPRNARQTAHNVDLENADVGISIIKGGWLGILRGRHWVTIWHVVAHSPADSAGIVPGDQVISVDQRHEVQQLLFSGDAGSTVDVALFRPSSGDTFTVSLTRKNIQGVIKDWPVYDMMASRDGAIWLGLWDGQAVRFYPDAPQPLWKSWSQQDGLPWQYGPRLYEDRHKRVWRITNYGGSIHRFQDQKWSPVNNIPLHYGGQMTGICEGNDGRLFLGGGQIAALKNGAWKTLKPKTMHPQKILPNHRVRLLFTKNLSLWVAGLGQGAVRLDLDPTRSQVFPDLQYQTDHPRAGTWFVAKNNRIVRQLKNEWTQFDATDGLIDTPHSVLVTPEGTVWAAGSHQNVAATAYFDGIRWHRKIHPRLSQTVSHNGNFVDSKNRLWFGAYHFDQNQGQVGGLLSFDGTTWHHGEPPEALEVVYSMGETQDGRIWAGTHQLQYFEDQDWHVMPTISDVWVHSILGATDGTLWIGTRLKGVYHYDGKKWRQFTQKDGLEGNFFESLIETKDGSIWVSGSQGVYRFDGQSWTSDVLPNELFGNIKTDSQGNVWTTAHEWGSAIFEMEKMPPSVNITSFVKEVTQPGNTLITWQGQDRWNDTKENELQYAWRLDDEAWSRYDYHDEKIFLGLIDGPHRFQLRARDKAFNTSQITTITFDVLAPIWKQTWFVALVTGFVLIIVWQSSRVVRRSRLLQQANTQLEHASTQLQTNVDVLRTLVDTVPIPIFLQDKEQTFTNCNKAFMDLLGHSPKDILGKPADSIWPATVAETESTTMKKVMETQSVQNYEIELQDNQGTPRQFIINKAPIYDPTRGFDGVVAAMFDITERQLAEAMALEIERDRVIIETAGAAAHNINQPLTVIVGMVDLLLRRASIDPAIRQNLIDIQKAGWTIDTIVKNMETVKEYRTEKYAGKYTIARFDSPTETENPSPSSGKEGKG